MLTKLLKYRAELEKARVKKAEVDKKVKDLEEKCQEEENTAIHEMVHQAKMSPEQLSRLLKMAVADRVRLRNEEENNEQKTE